MFIELLPHGNSDLVVEGQVIFVTLSGSFNKEGVHLYAQRLKAAVGQMHDNWFAMLVDDLQVEGGTPDAYAELQRLNEWMNQKKLLAKAFLIESQTTKDIILDRTPALAEQNIAFFKVRPDAVAWLQRQFEKMPVS